MLFEFVLFDVLHALLLFLCRWLFLFLFLLFAFCALKANAMSQRERLTATATSNKACRDVSPANGSRSVSRAFRPVRGVPQSVTQIKCPAQCVTARRPLRQTDRDRERERGTGRVEERQRNWLAPLRNVSCVRSSLTSGGLTYASQVPTPPPTPPPP